MAKIGFVGLGMMGNPMAQNLVRAGFDVVVYDIRPEATKEAAALGAQAAPNLELMGASDTVFIMVNTGAQVEQAMAGISAGVTTGKGPLVVVMATISPDLIKQVAQKAASKGIKVMDAPVSGAPILAQTGGLSIMVGGDTTAFESIKPYLEAMGKAIKHIGPLGMGLAMKLVNNLVGITNGYVLSEALKIGLASGLDINTMVEMMRASSGNNWIVENWDAYIAFLGLMAAQPRLLRDFHHTAAKDIETVLEWTKTQGWEAPVLDSVLSILNASDAMNIERVQGLLDAARPSAL
jgi:3-hydroxyisobutyrate dehydrogenase-like beta-hydroxyacid dehydrogenase